MRRKKSSDYMREESESQSEVPRTSAQSSGWQMDQSLTHKTGQRASKLAQVNKSAKQRAPGLGS
jgi:hypothetical protein